MNPNLLGAINASCSRVTMEFELKSVFEKLTARQDLTRSEARSVFERVMSGELSEAVIAVLLGAIAVKGESVEELVGAAEAMRAAVVPIRCDADCIDTCGTGGDGISTFNVSTTAAIIAAAAGATVAKHGNRSTTRVSGSTEVLTELGINVDADVATVERSLREARIGYLNAQMLHPAMKHAAAVRRVLPMRTIFNLLGPLTNPAGARRQLMGVPRAALAEKMARALIALDVKHAWIVHGSDGLCDLTITGPSTVVEVLGGHIRTFEVTPDQVGLERGDMETLKVTSVKQSAEAVLEVLNGKPGWRLNMALLNAGAAFVVAGKAVDLKTGVEAAGGVVARGEALATLERWRRIAGVG